MRLAVLCQKYDRLLGSEDRTRYGHAGNEMQPSIMLSQ